MDEKSLFQAEKVLRVWLAAFLVILFHSKERFIGIVWREVEFNIKIIWLRKWTEISKLGFWFFIFNTEKISIFSENSRTIDDFKMNRIWMNNPI